VGQTTPTTRLSASVQNPVYGQAITFYVTVSAQPGWGTPEGTVMLKDGSRNIAQLTLVGATAVFTTSSLSVGSHSLSAYYLGGKAMAPSHSSTMNRKVKGAAATATMIIQPTSDGTGRILDAYVTVVSPGTGSATGTITFQAGGRSFKTVPVVNGHAQFVVSNAFVNRKWLTARFTSNTKAFLTSTSDRQFVTT